MGDVSLANVSLLPRRFQALSPFDLVYAKSPRDSERFLWKWIGKVCYAKKGCPYPVGRHLGWFMSKTLIDINESAPEQLDWMGVFYAENIKWNPGKR